MTGVSRRRETLAVGAGDLGERLDLFIARSLTGVSRKAVKKALDGGRVFVDGRVERRAGLQLNGSETVELTLDLPPLPPPLPDLSVLFRDEYLLAVDKPPALPAHPTVAGRHNALELVTGMLRSEGVTFTPILLHRLDADTSGVLLFALTPEANRQLARQFVDREVEKTYMALVAGTPPDSFRADNHLKAGVRGRTVAVASGGQQAVTDFRILWRSSAKGSHALVKGGGTEFSLVEARPKTGRTHQIRAHLAGAGFPLLGDTLYGGPSFVELGGGRLHVRRHLLHAFRLTFRHPAAGEMVTIEAPVPEDFRDLLEQLP